MNCDFQIPSSTFSSKASISQHRVLSSPSSCLCYALFTFADKVHPLLRLHFLFELSVGMANLKGTFVLSHVPFPLDFTALRRKASGVTSDIAASFLGPTWLPFRGTRDMK